MGQKKEMGDYFREHIRLQRDKLISLEEERIRYGRFRRFVVGIDKNIRQTRKSLYYYEGLLQEYINRGLAE